MDNTDKIKIQPYSEPIVSTKIDSKVDVRVDITNVKNFIFDSGETEYILDINKLLELEILKETRKG